MSFAELVLGAVAVLVAALLLWRLSWTLASWVRLVASRLPGSSSGLEFVERVIDGDTLVLRGRGSCRIRGIDAPDAGWRKRRAGRVLRRFVGRRRVRVVFHGPDRYGRQVVDVWRGARSVEAHMRGRGAAVAWDGKGRSPLKKLGWRRLVFGR